MPYGITCTRTLQKVHVLFVFDLEIKHIEISIKNEMIRNYTVQHFSTKVSNFDRLSENFRNDRTRAIFMALL